MDGPWLMHIRKTMQLDSRHTPLAMQQPLADSTEIVIAYAGTNSNSLIDPDWATKEALIYSAIAGVQHRGAPSLLILYVEWVASLHSQ